MSVRRSATLRHTDSRLVITRLQQIHLVLDDINSETKKISASYEPTLDPFSSSFDKLLGQFADDFDRYRLDEVVVAAMSPVVSNLPNKCAPFLTSNVAPPLARDLEPTGRPIMADANIPPLAPRPQGIFGGNWFREPNSTSRRRGNINSTTNVRVSLCESTMTHLSF